MVFSFTVEAGVSNDTVNSCASATPTDPACDTVINFTSFNPTGADSVMDKTVESGFYICRLNLSDNTGSNTGSCFLAGKRVIAMSGNSLNNPTWQKVSSKLLRWRLSYRFSSQNAMPSETATIDDTCNPNTTFATSKCAEDQLDTGPARAWHTGPGWYFLVVRTRRTSGTSVQPYSISMGVDSN